MYFSKNISENPYANRDTYANVVCQHPFEKLPLRAVFHALVKSQGGKMNKR